MAAFTTAAEAGRGGMRFGGGMRHFRHHAHHNHHHHHHRHRHHRRQKFFYVSPKPTYTEETYSVRRVRPAAVAPARVAVKYADGMGRMFDPASKAWFDGIDKCWSGGFPWTFKAGSWYYGSYRWYPAGGSWQTDAPEPPTPVDCGTVPAFAAKAGPAPVRGAKKAERLEPAQSEPEVDAEAEEKAPVKMADEGAGKKPAKASTSAGRGGCKKYFPSVGAMLPVPCE
jgi:hypothetical protein